MSALRRIVSTAMCPSSAGSVFAPCALLTATRRPFSGGVYGGSNGTKPLGDKQQSESAKAAEEWLKSRITHMVNEGKMTQEAAAQYLSFHLPQMNDLVKESIAKAREDVGGDNANYDNLTRHQQMQFGKKVSNALNDVAANEIRQLHERHDADDRMRKGEDSGENYWIEAQDFFSNPEIPSFLKDDVFEDMKRDRVVNPVTGLTAAETITDADRDLMEQLRVDLDELSKEKKSESEATTKAADGHANPTEQNTPLTPEPIRDPVNIELERSRRRRLEAEKDNIPLFE